MAVAANTVETYDNTLIREDLDLARPDALREIDPLSP